MYYFQTDNQWANEEMAMKGDSLGLYGCYVTAISNILKYRGVNTNPKKLNKLIKNIRGYFGLKNPLENINKYSFLIIEDLEKIYNFKKTSSINSKNLKYGVDIYYIGKIEITTKKLGTIKHFINIIKDLGNEKICYNTYDGSIMNIKNEDFLDVYKIEFGSVV